MLATILIIEPTDEKAVELSGILEREGYRTIEATSPECALDVARREKPDLVLLDLDMPGPGLRMCRELKSDPLTQDAAVVLLSGSDDIQEEARGFDVGAADYIHKPFEQVDLLARVQNQLRFKSKLDELQARFEHVRSKLLEGSELTSDIDQACIESERKSIRLNNDVDRVHGVVNQLLVGIGARLTNKQRSDLMLGLHEMVLNAIEHGNLGINSGQEREAIERSELDELIRERLARSELASREVFVDYEYEGDEVRFRIRDEGNGFDWRLFLNRDEPEDIFASNGRGIMISRFIFDEIDYNDRGNEVVLKKFL